MIPHPWQSAAVQTFHALGGLFLGQPPGSGKTYVIAECLKRAERPLLICPASARTQTRKMLEGYGCTSAYASYSQVSRDPELLNRYRPDVLAVDESQALKNVKDSAWGRRIARYIAENPSCRVVCSSGSVMHRGALDYMPQLVWALRGRAPCPGTWAGMQRVAREAAENPEAWLAKLRECPGVFIESAHSWAGELVIREHTLSVSDDSAYARAAATGLAPDGWACEGFALAEILRQLSWGWYMARTPRPSERLLEARRTWAKCVTQAKAFGLADTDMGARKHFPGAWASYKLAAEAEPEAEPVPVWVESQHDGLGLLGRLMPRHSCIIWVHHTPLGERLQAAFDLPYHRDGTLDAQGRRLDETDAPVVVASISACHKSVNAQKRFSHNIVLEPPADARVWQQLLCRTARQGQLATRVTCDIVIASPTYAADLATARKLAAAIERETGQAQLLLTPVTKEETR
jgi:hypothetical protein